MDNSKKVNFNLDFIYIGAPRAASTWLYTCLKDHPEVCVSQKKEFNPFDENWEIAEERLSHQFKICPSTNVKGSFPVTFMYQRDSAINLKKHFPSIKIIISLRNPIFRFYSHYYFNLAKGEIKENITLDQIIKSDRDIIKFGKYYEYLKPYFDIFPKENILIIFYEDIRIKPLKILQDVCTFLGVSANFVSPKADQYINPVTKKRIRSKFIKNVINKIFNLSGKIQKTKMGFMSISLLKKFKVDHFLNFINRINLINPAGDKLKRFNYKIKDKNKRRLLTIYLNDIEQLERLLNKDLSHWKKI